MSAERDWWEGALKFLRGVEEGVRKDADLVLYRYKIAKAFALEDDVELGHYTPESLADHLETCAQRLVRRAESMRSVAEMAAEKVRRKLHEESGMDEA